jgi:glycosyltransferase involved in cell wall biosynthesis
LNFRHYATLNCRFETLFGFERHHIFLIFQENQLSTPFGKAVFVGCAKDCANFLPRVLRNVESIAQLYSEVAFIFIENDSRDRTKDILQRWCHYVRNARLISLDGLSQSHPIRTVRLAHVRNQYLHHIRTSFSDYDHLFTLDCDEVNINPLDLTQVRKAITFLDSDPSHAGVFANQQGLYYDLWALRHPLKCPGDAWEEVLDDVEKRNVSDQDAFKTTFAKRLFSLAADAGPLEVDSAFGGLAIYKVSSVLRNKRNFIGHKIKRIDTPNGSTKIGWQTCEHVSFNAGFREQGDKLFVLPYLTNSITPDDMIFPPSVFRTMIFDPLKMKQGSQNVTLGRNDPCWCDSGKRYKHCHGMS